MVRNTVIGVFENDNAAREVCEDLKREGFSESDIHLSSREREHHRSFVEWLENLFSSGPKEDAPTFQSAIYEGRSVVAVDTDDSRMDRAAQLLKSHGAIDVNESDQNLQGNSAKASGEQRSIPVIEQDLEVQKKTVLHGGIRVYSRVSEQPVEKDIRLRQEKVRAERVKLMILSRPKMTASPSDNSA